MRNSGECPRIFSRLYLTSSIWAWLGWITLKIIIIRNKKVPPLYFFRLATTKCGDRVRGAGGGITLLGVKFQGTLPTLLRCTFLMKYSMMPKVIWGHRITLLWLRIFWPYKNLVFHSFVFNFCWKWNLKVQNKLDKLSNLLSRLLLIIKLISYYYIFTNYLVVLNDT